jgi:deoxyribodipyrimidine photolyase
MSTGAIVWLRQDLRLLDNPALAAAAKLGGPIVPVYILCDAEEREFPAGGASRWWLHRSLAALGDELRSQGSQLSLLRGPALECLREAVARTGARAVFWNRRYEPAAVARDIEVKTQLRADGLVAESFNGSLLREPWQCGRTGIPLVDAGMRQLWATGWMHNRVRMIVASFLVKNLRIHWLAGARWFWDTLVDADLAANTLNWQWVAGCGADAAPYFRIFNPRTQSGKFDPAGDYIRRWVPELARLDAPHVHAPHVAAGGAGRVPGYLAAKMLQPPQAADVSVRLDGAFSQNRSPYSRTRRSLLNCFAQLLAHLSTLVTTGLLSQAEGMDRVWAAGPSSSM